MPTPYEILRIEFNKCPPDCRLCEEACTQAKQGSLVASPRINTIHAPKVKYHGALTCIQCGQPRCVQICPAGAIEKNLNDGIIRIDESKCVGCGLCTISCPYGGIYYDANTRHSFKCDRCNGDPKCVAACPYGVLTNVRNEPVLSYLKGEDVLSPGIGACRGCPVELALRFTLRVLGKDIVLFTAPGCAITFILGFGEQAQIGVTQFPCLLGNVAATMTGVSRLYKNTGRDVRCVAFAGDGATVDIGFQALSGAAERQENFIYICYDNEGYMNTGIQRSGSTPISVSTTTTPVGPTSRGKEQNSKYLPLIMLFHDIPYVATASMAYLEDYAKKLSKAMSVKNGMAYIHLYSPCPTGWGIPEDGGLDVARLAVETNYFPLWEAEKGKVSFTYEIAHPKPVQEYIKSMGKYSHLSKEELKQVQEMVDSRFRTIKILASAT